MSAIISQYQNELFDASHALKDSFAKKEYLNFTDWVEEADERAGR